MKTLRSVSRAEGSARPRQPAHLVVAAIAAVILLPAAVRVPSSTREAAAGLPRTAMAIDASSARAALAGTTPAVGAPAMPSPGPQAGDRRRPKRQAAAPARPELAASSRAPLEDTEDLLAAGEIARACEVGERAVRQAPELPAIRAFLGRCYMRLGRTADARAHYARYLALAPTAPDAPFIRAIVGRDRP